jgi:hypothetical protein
MQSSCSGRQEGRPATVVACYPSGERCPSCDECARYWLGLRPDATWIESLESYRDPLQEARQALDAMRPSPAPEAPHVAITGQVISTPGHRKRLSAWAWGTGSAFTAGFFLFLGNAKAGGPGAVTGVLLILASLLTGVVAVVVMIAKDAQAAHAKWLAQHTPEQQAAIRAAEKAALWTGAAVGAVALHEHNRHSRERQAAQWQAREAASKERNAAFAARQQHQELLDAVRSQGGTASLLTPKTEMGPWSQYAPGDARRP